MSDDNLIETCLVCVVCWDMHHDPPQCYRGDHPHAINKVSAWSKVGHGLAEEPTAQSPRSES